MPMKNLEALKPAEQVFQVVSALFGETPPGSDAEMLKALFKKQLDFQSRSYFLGIHPSWLEALVVSEPAAIQEAFQKKNPILMQVLKTQLTRMSQQEGLLKLGHQQLSAYLVKIGKAKTARLLSKQPKDIQDAILAQLEKASNDAVCEQDLEFIFKLKYDGANNLFKQVGLYCKDPTQINELAQRLEHAEGQKLITLLKK